MQLHELSDNYKSRRRPLTSAREQGFARLQSRARPRAQHEMHANDAGRRPAVRSPASLVLVFSSCARTRRRTRCDHPRTIRGKQSALVQRSTNREMPGDLAFAISPMTDVINGDTRQRPIRRGRPLSRVCCRFIGRTAVLAEVVRDDEAARRRDRLFLRAETRPRLREARLKDQGSSN